SNRANPDYSYDQLIAEKKPRTAGRPGLSLRSSKAPPAAGGRWGQRPPPSRQPRLSTQRPCRAGLGALYRCSHAVLRDTLTRTDWRGVRLNEARDWAALKQTTERRRGGCNETARFHKVGWSRNPRSVWCSSFN